MEKKYSDEELFLGKNAFYYIGFGMLMMADPLYSLFNTYLAHVSWIKYCLFIIYPMIFIYFLVVSFKYVFTTNSEGKHVFTVNIDADEYFESVKKHAYQYTFNINVIFMFVCYLLFKYANLNEIISLELLSKLFLSIMLISYGTVVFVKLKRDEPDHE